MGIHRVRSVAVAATVIALVLSGCGGGEEVSDDRGGERAGPQGPGHQRSGPRHPGPGRGGADRHRGPGGVLEPDAHRRQPGRLDEDPGAHPAAALPIRRQGRTNPGPRLHHRDDRDQCGPDDGQLQVEPQGGLGRRIAGRRRRLDRDVAGLQRGEHQVPMRQHPGIRQDRRHHHRRGQVRRHGHLQGQVPRLDPALVPDRPGRKHRSTRQCSTPGGKP